MCRPICGPSIKAFNEVTSRVTLTRLSVKYHAAIYIYRIATTDNICCSLFSRAQFVHTFSKFFYKSNVCIVRKIDKSYIDYVVEYSSISQAAMCSDSTTIEIYNDSLANIMMFVPHMYRYTNLAKCKKARLCQFCLSDMYYFALLTGVATCPMYAVCVVYRLPPAIILLSPVHNLLSLNLFRFLVVYHQHYHLPLPLISIYNVTVCKCLMFTDNDTTLLGHMSVVSRLPPPSCRPSCCAILFILSTVSSSSLVNGIRKYDAYRWLCLIKALAIRGLLYDRTYYYHKDATVSAPFTTYIWPLYLR